MSKDKKYTRMTDDEKCEELISKLYNEPDYLIRLIEFTFTLAFIVFTVIVYLVMTLYVQSFNPLLWVPSAQITILVITIFLAFYMMNRINFISNIIKNDKEYFADAIRKHFSRTS